jgi:hypothetical protein
VLESSASSISASAASTRHPNRSALAQPLSMISASGPSPLGHVGDGIEDGFGEREDHQRGISKRSKRSATRGCAPAFPRLQ